MIPATTAVFQRPSAMPFAGSRAPALVTAMAELWRTLTKDLFGPYRPELHYMRGPGPKWREKHAGALAVTRAQHWSRLGFFSIRRTSS